MTEKLYDQNSYLSEFSAVVLDCKKTDDSFKIILDKTAFFPEGGGQSSDTGFIDNIEVYDVQIENKVIFHFTKEPISIGKEVDCRLDFEKRFRKMQNHSGEHIISGIVNRKYGYENVGFHLGDNEMTLDFSGELSRKQIKEIEYLANEAVYKNAKFTCWYPSLEELEGITYRSKLDLKEDVRLVKIDGYDICACCAPHVKSASEIGIIKILDFFKNKGGVRLFAKCGYDAIDDYNKKYENGLYISNALSLKQDEIAVGVDNLLSKIKDFKTELSGLKKQLIEQKINLFETENYTTALFEDDVDMKDLQMLADCLYKKCGGIRGVFSKKEEWFNFSICGEEKELSSFFNRFKEKFKVKGGGRNGMVQGTVFAEKEEILDFFQK